MSRQRRGRIEDLVNPDTPRKLISPQVLADVADMDAVMAFNQTQAAADAMAYDGVLPESIVILIES